MLQTHYQAGQMETTNDIPNIEHYCLNRFTFDKLPQNSTPEILRTPLDSLILQVKAMQSSGVSSYEMLKNCIDPPSGFLTDYKF